MGFLGFQLRLIFLLGGHVLTIEFSRSVEKHRLAICNFLRLPRSKKPEPSAAIMVTGTDLL
jgi:hypothetical protein